MSKADYKNPIPSKSQHALIVQQLGLKIVSGEISENEKLPSEVDLCEEYKVSRPVFREAIRVLNAKGLTYSRPKIGTVVRPKEEWHLLDPDVLFWLIQTTPEHEFFKTLSTVRRVLEPELAYIAASTANEEDIERIKQAYEGMEKATTVEEFIEPDIQFHLAIAKATHNDLLAYMSKMLVLPLQQSIQVTSLRPNLQGHSLPRHKAILTAIENKDPLSARHASLVQLDDTKMAYDLIKK
ncbi:TPA: FadR/GntR family transcriptional regulator [Acinetobacter baumannii]|jgi:DNA-binding FadR family transcriptional regulator|uniref:FCD domain-containing protein n=45 Tax=Gammaproteobacteria TaxID=1236 RepID=V5VEB2_ACIBA|nr:MULTISPECIES: FadR/GntR family transcriptional regulator [Acinetobacter]ADX92590.1 transcriptional regulator [Acinetobacter baumannii TCDC-AB0715]AHX27970.1 GntR family transcriptional regulator [Acinetobacter baumannii AC12]AHX64725.1 GntR family transcriptional regulator [Acinetobacter baumannii AC30]EMT92402.1 GntR family transcriptional regulator [Acinetobacter baumannii ABNIH6]EMT95691.1 GntR family transcriptional regulator [Acinetobacter baumannii ABNIH10]ETY69230.1 GntR family tran